MTNHETVNSRRTLQGRVVSDRMNKTVTVLIERKVRHSVIGKILIKSKKYHAHVDNMDAVLGDLVQIEECAPISKTKSWRVMKVLDKA